MEYIIRVYTVGGKFLGEEKLYSDLDEIEKIIMSYIKVGNIVIIGEDISSITQLAG